MTGVQKTEKSGDDLIRCVNEPEIDRKALSERAALLKITISAVLKAAEDFVEVSDRGSRRMGKVVITEQKEKVILQEQLETLAKQHSNLERVALTDNMVTKPPLSAYSDDMEDEFHDAAEELSLSGSRRNDSGRNSVSEPFSTLNDGPPSADASMATAPSSFMSNNSIKNRARAGRERRTTVPDRPDLPINLWSIMKNCIGKELSKIPMPVNFSEPLSVLQRITEDLEYASLLETASSLEPFEQMAYVAAYAVSNYSTTGNRTNKPFNPLLGETYEFDRTADLGWRSITEQVSHHPPAAAHHAEGNGWVMYQDFTMTSRFRGKYLSVIPVGYTHVYFPGSKNHYSYKKITTTVHNIIVGKLWIDNHGDMEIINHGTGDKCVVKFFPYSYFSRDTPRKIYGVVQNSAGEPKMVVQGTWDKAVDMCKVLRSSGTGDKAKFDVGEPKRIWTVNPPIPGAERMHNFTKLAVELNEPEPGVAPTDSRLRPDQRLMEEGRWDEANRKKLELEEKQRVVRRRRESEMEKAMQQGLSYEEYQPKWFQKTQDELTGTLIHKYLGSYWSCKEKGDWSGCPTIF